MSDIHETLKSIYGQDLLPVRPGKKPTRTPVTKLAGSLVEAAVPGPGSYSPSMSMKPRLTGGVMGEKKARKSSCQISADSPGPVYMMASSITAQVNSVKASSPRFGFGTSNRDHQAKVYLSQVRGARAA